MERRNNTILYIAAAVVAVVMASCSQTSSIPDGDKLYTGMKATQYTDYDDNSHFESVREELDLVLETRPNASLFGSAYHRSPFPIGLWVWNAFARDSSVVARWINRSFGSRPMLMSQINPNLRTTVGENLLEKRGYFNGEIAYDLLPRRNPKKEKIRYHVSMGHLWTVDSLDYVGFPSEADSLIRADSVNARLHNGDAFDVAALEEERQRVTTLLRDNGYYFYNKNNASYLADTASISGRVLTHLQLADSVPQRALRKWYIGNVTVNMRKNFMEELDSSHTFRHLTINYNGRKPPVRLGVIFGNLKLRHGNLYSYDKYLESLQKVNATGIFSQTQLSFAPHDTTDSCRYLDMTLDCLFDKPYDFYVEAYGKGKTSGRFGPELIVGLEKRNAFRGGELFNVQLHGSYEWQWGRRDDGTSSHVASYEYGAEASIEFPRIVNPFRMPFRKRIERERRRRERALARGEKPQPRKRRHNRFYSTPKTLLKASFDVLNRADYFKRHVVSGELTYDWQPSAHSHFTFSPLTLSYEYMQSRTQRFIELEDSMPYIKTSMADQFIPKMSLSYNWRSRVTERNPLTWWTTLSEAGNVLNLGYTCAGDGWGEKGKTMFKNPFAQFIKLETNLTKVWQIGEASSIAAHVNAGAIWSFGNALVAPYTEQFYVGGANSIRAFNTREIGPGKYRSTSQRMSYVEQTGDIKFQMNLEYRPRLFGNLYGAVFLDAGNVWAMRDDVNRPGAKFEFKNFFKQMAVGTGIGLRYDLTYFIIRIDWGIGLHVPYETNRHGFYNIDHFNEAQALHFAVGLPF